MVALHRKKHGGDVEKSLADVPAGKFTRERLATLGLLVARSRSEARPANQIRSASRRTRGGMG
jgi:hypothetical protein